MAKHQMLDTNKHPWEGVKKSTIAVSIVPHKQYLSFKTRIQYDNQETVVRLASLCAKQEPTGTMK